MQLVDSENVRYKIILESEMEIEFDDEGEVNLTQVHHDVVMYISSFVKKGLINELRRKCKLYNI